MPHPGRLALIGAMLLLGSGCWLWWIPHRREQIAIEKIVARGENVEFLPVTSKWSTLAGERLARLLWRETSVNLEIGNGISDEDWQLLQNLRSVTSIGLTRDGIRDADLRRLSSFRDLRRVAIWSRQVTNAGLQRLGDLPALDTVIFHGDQIDDLGIKELSKMKRLKVLTLGGAQITDACVPDLARLTNLKYLEVRFTCITPSGRAALRRALPGCRVNPKD
jgi:hypothetical protein